MMSHPVEIIETGYHSAIFLNFPSIPSLYLVTANGHNPELNHVSKTSESWYQFPGLFGISEDTTISCEPFSLS
jgi:hypothetical protein